MKWSDDFLKFLQNRFGVEPKREEIETRFAWVGELHAQARELLAPENLRAIPPHEVYARLKALNVPHCPIRITNLGRVNEAEKVVESLLKLLETQGGFEEKYRAAKIGQTGVVTISEILCVYRPMRFVLRNTAFTKAAAKVVPLYTKRALDELPYNEFLDTCGELAKVTENYLQPTGLSDWARELRYLLLYAVLTES
jgi:hypothetical protein